MTPYLAAILWYVAVGVLTFHCILRMVITHMVIKRVGMTLFTISMWSLFWPVLYAKFLLFCVYELIKKLYGLESPR